MIERIFKEPHVFYQEADADWMMPELDIVISKDNSNLIILKQRGSEIILNKKSIKELCAFLKEY